MGVNLREDWEILEYKILSPRAAKSDKAERLLPEENCPLRTAFQRDRDRIIHSKSFRRLIHKTQVFLSPEGDHYRTRLTHTLEVMQISRTISRCLKLNEDLTEAISLGHDLGHPPFGHAGEEALNEAVNLRTGGSFKHYEQSLRVVDFIERRFSQEGKLLIGLNLTNETRDGILNHAKGLGSLEGYGKAKTLEGEVVKYSDVIAYVNHDLDDAIRASIIYEENIPAVVTQVLGSSTTVRIKSFVEELVKYYQDKNELGFSPSVNQALHQLREFLKNNLYLRVSPAKSEEGKARKLIINLYDYLMENNDFPSLKTENKNQAVVDYLSGMTDRFALSFYEKHFLPSPFGLD
ncbi:MAG: Deoxyguanosinetriphosphate triphosphohydrolase-like protein [candidate division WS2 bacterium]|uniref:Deoxyguanosinetriphosphate triphosphohydrolase-like protein n=1 Tax=Psychracetigena formicireducens TaxID=2986056 RepID=A0A9E2F173_PSYF1|nr:Deoxyguanosinetriphosphate triphosphohydrolase-like protein [Candidatus Psychracetigena formicireducens]MBT9144447.1 Deoxyguanosinetriphosphate triphosphohydrolase-like protein [Candidatus Psychracetigena formicireducens]